MELLVKYIPIGDLPYESVQALSVMQSRLLPWCPYLSILPKLEPGVSVLSRTLSGFASFEKKDDQIFYKFDKEYMYQIDKIYNAPTFGNTEKFRIQSPFKEEFLKVIKTYKSPYASVSLYAPFSLSRVIHSTKNNESLDITDKMVRKLLVQTIVIKALSIIYEIKDTLPETTPVIILEDPFLNRFSITARENPAITLELVTTLYSKVVNALHNAGAKVAVRSMNRCNWKIPIRADVDMISFDACRNPHNLRILADDIKEFISRGGQLNYAIVPARNEKEIQKFKPDFMFKKLFVEIDALAKMGIPREKLCAATSISLYGDPNNLSLFFAEKANMNAVNFAKKITIMQNLYR